MGDKTSLPCPPINKALQNNLETCVVYENISSPIVTPYIAVIDEEIVCTAIGYLESS